jgi:DNA polymerase I
VFDGNVSPVALIEAAKAAKCFVFDLETTGLSPHEDRIEGIAFFVPATKTAGPVRAWYPFVGSTFLICDKDGSIVNVREPMPQRETMEALRPIFSMPDVVAIAHNSKFDIAFLRCASGCVEPIEIKNRLADSMLADYLSDERRRRYGLKIRVRQVFEHEMTTYAEAVRGQALLNFMPQKPLGAYAMDDCQWTYEHFARAIWSLRKQTPARRSAPKTPTEKEVGRSLGDLEALFWGLEMKLARVLMEMETTGVFIDWQHLVNVEERLNKKRQEIADRIEDFLGWPCNPRATHQVVDALFAPPPDGLGLPRVGVPVGKEGLPSTSDKVIKHFKRFHPLVQDILELRSIEVVLSGFVRKIRKLAQESFDGRIRTKFNQTGTVIGRLSCVHGDTVLNTSLGDVRIADLDMSNGQSYTVPTHQGRHRRILRKIFKGPDQMYEVKLANGNTIRCTADHRFLTESGWKALRDIRPGDKLVVSDVHQPPDTDQGAEEGS